MNGLSTQKIPKRIFRLNDLAQNLWWSWHEDARELFKAIDRPLWKSTGHNPVELLHQIEPFRLVSAGENPEFLKKYDSVIGSFERDLSGDQTWVQLNHPILAQHPIAFFSMEFAFHNSLPIYAGGLGVLAGDFCKEASDLGLPLIGIGLMYPQGYFQQRMSDTGWQEETYRQLNFSNAPIIQVLNDQKEILKVEVKLDSRSVNVAVWQVNVGRVKVYLLDTNLEDNSEVDRQLTARLYSADRDIRLQQEVILGFGGVRILKALDIEPSIWHANEGHTTFMMLERLQEMMDKGQDFQKATDKIRATTVFTTHTPVPAGNDAFSHGQIDKYLHLYCNSTGLDKDSILRLGTQDADKSSFNMTVFGLKMAQYRNGVSELHGAVCRKMWSGLWPNQEEKDIPIGSVTNGVHVPTWVSPQMNRLYKKYLGDGWIAKHDDPAMWENIRIIPDEEMWSTRLWLKNKLISAMQNRARKRWTESGGSPSAMVAMGALLDCEVLTIGFSRRFTGYKRASLLLHDAERLKRMLRDDLRPIQLVFSGKAHPNDEQGKHLIQQVYALARDPAFGGRIAFVEDYDLRIAHYIIPGVDVWLNTPRRLQEASGTSGMKAAVNGVPHLSVLDGWWYEGYNGTNGWAIGGVDSCDNQDEQDNADANALYSLLEEKIVPLYYDRDVNGIPHGWISLVNQAIRSCSPLFSAKRMLKEYTTHMYLPVANVNTKTLLSSKTL